MPSIPAQPTGKEPAWRLPGFDNVGTAAHPRYRARNVPKSFVHRFLAVSKSIHQQAREELVGGMQHVRSILDQRDSILTPEQSSCLHEAYNHPIDKRCRRNRRSTDSKPVVHHKGVYIWIHRRSGNPKVYVGSFHSQCMTARTRDHICGANAHAYRRALLPRWKQLPGFASKGLYSHMVQHGCHDLLVFPLQLLPADALETDVLYAEQQWIHRFNSLIPHGYNARNAATDVEVDRLYCSSRYYNCRNMCRRVVACYKAHVQHRLNEHSAEAYFMPFLTRTLIQMHVFCKVGYSRDGVSATDLLGAYQVPANFANELYTWLSDILAVRFGVVAVHPSRRRRLMLCSYWTTVFDQLNFQSAFFNAACDALPDSLRDRLPVVGFKYSPPLGLKWCNHSKIANSLKQPAIQQLLSSPCVCEQDQWLQSNGHVHAGCGHVVSCSADVLRNCPDGLKHMFRMGFKHRPELLSLTMSQEIRDLVQSDLKAALDDMLVKQPARHALWSAWADRVLHYLQVQLNSEKFADGRVFNNASKPHEPGAAFCPYLHDYDNCIRSFHKDFVITTADKLSNNYVVVCKKYYVEMLLQDLNSGSFYEQVTLPAAVAAVVDSGTVPQQDGVVTAPSVHSVFDEVVDKLRLKINDLQAAKDMYGDCTTEALWREALSSFPYQSGIVKLHKDPLQFRFLACSKRNGLKRPAVWLTHLFKGVHCDLVDAWTAKLAEAGVPWSGEPPWHATRSAQVVDIVRAFNSLNMSLEEFVEGGGWHGYDVVRLYTNIDIADLLKVLTAVLVMVWARHESHEREATVEQTVAASTAVVQVFHDTTHKPVWYTSLNAAYAKCGQPCQQNAGVGMLNYHCGKHKFKGRFILLKLSEAVDILKLLVENSYVRFGDLLFHQTRGIPMGINPAVYMANYYLFYYEFQFITQLVDLMKRYPPGGPAADMHVDDLLNMTAVNEVMLPQNVMYIGDAARTVLQKFRCTVRFVDDFTSGPNPFTSRLLYTNQSLMGGLIHGLYPGQFLELEETKGDDLYHFSTLDVNIVTTIQLVCDSVGLPLRRVVHSHTRLFDKRKKACYASLPIVQYTNVSSTLSASSGYNILLSQLFRYRELITHKGNYVLEVAKLIKRMQCAGYKGSILFRKLKHHLKLHPYTYGDHNFRLLFYAVKECHALLGLLPSSQWEQFDVDSPAVSDYNSVHMYDVDGDALMADAVDL